MNLTDVEGIVTELKRLYADGRKLPTRRCWICHFYFGFYFVPDPTEIRYDQGCYCRGQSLATEVSTMNCLREFIVRSPLRARAWIKWRTRELAVREKLEADRKAFYEDLAKKRRLAEGRLPLAELPKKPKAQTKAEIQAALYAAAVLKERLN